ncbi:branched-chain amino acid ABC transporter permease [Martelella alba]|uniref:Branched-chain amino acid ABC transporter permease n=1 Tax=Martelella alba TaxID=2590451 RepID=A0ABY2SPV3_9HYPH|nr:branched-chain amino acid ABC transporter permease [Martelella alba]TKI07895.1 branched-chain amino acid ABC transporter permease [Martelella alba]
MLQFLMDTLIRAADLSLVALGLSLVYGLVRFANIAHMQYAMVGAFVTAAGLRLGMPLSLAIVFSALVCGVLSTLLHHWVFQPLLKSGTANAMIGSLAVSMVLTALALGVEGSAPVNYPLPISAVWQIGDTRVSSDELWSLGVTCALIAVFSLLLFRTPQGRAIRALASNRDLATACGLNASAIIHSVNLVAGMLAAVGGSMLAMNASAWVNQGNDLMLPVLACAILGGLGNPMGAIFGALLIAATETTVTNIDWSWLFGGDLLFIPVTWVNASSFVILLLALLLRPYGLFNREVRRV